MLYKSQNVSSEHEMEDLLVARIIEFCEIQENYSIIKTLRSSSRITNSVAVSIMIK